MSKKRDETAAFAGFATLLFERGFFEKCPKNRRIFGVLCEKKRAFVRKKRVFGEKISKMC